MKTLKDLYNLMVSDDNEARVLNLKAEYPESLDIILNCLPVDIIPMREYDRKKFGSYVLDEYIFPILRNGELKCRLPIDRLVDEKTKKYKEVNIFFSHKMDIEEFISIFKKEWELDQKMAFGTEFGIPSIVWKDE